MPTNYTNRFITIAIVMLVAIWCIFPGMFKGHFKPDLKPGIDMVGGTSLLYEIKVPEGANIGSTNLVNDVMAALKKRVDPEGVRNLIWRPQGNTRLEIQMPLTNQSGLAQKVRTAFSTAQANLEGTNVRTGEVLHVVETMSGDARREHLNQLAMGSEQRQTLFGALASTWDQIQEAKKRKDAGAQADKELEYDKLKSQIDLTNVDSQGLENLLNGPDGVKRLGELNQKFAKWPARLQALDAFAKANADYQAIKGSVEDANELKKLLRGSGVLEFHILVDWNPKAARESWSPEVRNMYDRLLERGPIVEGTDTMRWYPADRPDEMADRGVQWNGKTWVLAYTAPDKSMYNRPGQATWALASAHPAVDQRSGERIVSFTFDAQGGKYFGDLTTNNVGHALGIVLDDRMISAPNVREPITSGGGQISGGRGGFNEKEQAYLVSMLSAGSLPARLTDEPISEVTLGAQIGADNLRAGFIACAFGIFVVAVFLIGYYYLSGVVAFIAVLLNMVLILGSMAALNATFTLPGVAGIVLTIGMAVDANVLIFERLREEQQRGLSLRMALRNAYDRAWSAILDGNVTTGITAAALYMFGSEEVKGFGLTLMLGIVASLFTALYVTKTIFGIMIDYGGIQKLGSLPLTFPRLDEALRPNIDWMSKAKYFYAFSVLFIVIGCTLFFVKLKEGQMMDIEFASGTSVTFNLKQPMQIEDVRAIIDKASEQHREALPAPQVVAVQGTEDKTYQVVTPNEKAPQVRDVIMAAMGDKLDLQLPSKFEGSNQRFELALDKQVLPIMSETQKFGEITPSPRDMAEHMGGVAIVLKNLNPPISAAQIKSRFERARMQPAPGQAQQPYRDITVLNDAPKAEAGASNAVILISDPSFSYEKDQAKWAQGLAAPMWALVNEGVAGEATLQKVVNFDAQVAAETQSEAAIALIMSIVGIMAYIWLRFGNLRFGSGTVVALVHDALFTIAAIGFAHYISETSIGRSLLVEPFRINLTMVAAILTIMGYSMNDTVVIFDRIRENRGKFGVLSRNVVNDSINQTLSRTLLTGGTTILTIFVMYIWGGAGIHGFTYALLLGILVGTYSSIAIASPILLVGGGDADSGQRGATNESTKQAPVGQLQRA
jgi:SecD/SecF fusion protein